MSMLRALVPVIALLLAACSTPYRPAVVVRDSAPFSGLAGIIAAHPDQPVDVILIHGICTHDRAWADSAIDRVAGIVDAHAPAPAPRVTSGGIELVERTRRVGGGTVRFHALLWSPLTASLKQQLDDDKTATSTDCAADRVCKPVRARLNAIVKDRLLDDCLSDALIYEGDSHRAIHDAMVESVSQVIDAGPNDAGTLVVVAESLGSKMLFDALSSMLESNQARTQALGRQASRRLALVFMAGNQLPILGLAEQTVAERAMPSQDALERFLALRRRQRTPRADTIARLDIVAFTDPNDVLSYRLLPARYAAPDVMVANVLVSNDKTWLGLIENPMTAHLDYLANPDVGTLIACGYPRIAACR